MAHQHTTKGTISSQLPQELLLNIFQRLPVSDVKVCRCVCRSWAWSASILLADSTFLNFKASMKDEFHQKYLSSLSIATFKSIKLKKVSIGFSSDTVAANWLWGPVITSSTCLTLEKCSLTERDFIRIITHYLGRDFRKHLTANDSENKDVKVVSTLKSLALIDCRDLFMSGGLMDQPDDMKIGHIAFCNVTSLDLSRNTYVTDLMFQRLVCCMPQLETLILNDTNIQHHPGIYKKFYPEHVIQGEEEIPEEEERVSRIFNSPSIFTFGCLLHYLRSTDIKITKLGLQGTNLPVRMINELFNIPSLKLKCLDISKNPALRQEGISYLTERHKSHLRELDLSYCRRIAMDYNSDLLRIFENLSNLTKLIIHGISCPRGFDECLAYLKQLEYLDLTDCDIPARHLADGIVKPLEEASIVNVDGVNRPSTPESHSIINEAERNCCARKLRVIIFSKYFRAPEQIARILRWTSNLKQVNFNGCTLSQDAMSQLFQTLHSSGLEDLNLNKCEETGGLDPKAQLLEPKELKMPEQINYKVIRERLNGSVTGGNVNLRSKFGNVGDLKALTVLRISENLVTDLTIINAFHFYDLRTIDVSGCENITSNGFIALAYQNTHIEHFYAKSCNGLDDIGVIAIACCLKRLVHLNIESCYNVTSTALSLTSGCDTLVGLQPNSHWSPNSKGLSGCKFLRLLNISKCTEISIVAVDALLDILGPSLKIKMAEETNARNMEYLAAFH